MEKLNQIDSFLKFFPNMNIDEEGNTNNDVKPKSKSKSKDVERNSTSLNEIKRKVQEKISKFNVNTRKNNKRPRPKGKNHREKGEVKETNSTSLSSNHSDIKNK